MKVVKISKPVAAVPRVRGSVITDGVSTFMEAGMLSAANMVVNLETGAIQNAGTYRDPDDVLHPQASVLLDGVPPVAVPPVKTATQHAQEFLKWGYDNPSKSQFSNITIYTPGEVIEGRTNANIRRQWHTWLAARGV